MKRLQRFLKIIFLAVVILQSAGLTEVVRAMPPAQTVPDYVQAYLQSGETAYPMIPVTLEAGQYELYLVANKAVSPPLPEDVFYQRNHAGWNARGIQAVLVFDSSHHYITDQDLLRQIFLNQIGGYLEVLSKTASPPPYAYVPASEDIVKELTKVTDSPGFKLAYSEQRLKNFLKLSGDEAWYAALLRLAISSPDTKLIDYAKNLENNFENGLSVIESFHNAVKFAELSADPALAAVLDDVEKTLSGFEKKIVNNSLTFKYKDVELDYANWVKLAKLVTNLVFIESVSKERVELLEALAADAQARKINLSSDLQSAIKTVARETSSDFMRRGEIIDEFVRENSADLAIQLTEAQFISAFDAFRKTNLNANFAGVHVSSAQVAGALSSVFTGYNVAKILYGMESVYENLQTVEFAAKFAEELENNLKAYRQSIGNTVSVYPENADSYRRLAIWWNFGIAQGYRSRANAVNAAGLIGLIASFGSWGIDTQGLINHANNGEKTTYETLIRPKIVEYAITLPILRKPAAVIPGIQSIATTTVLVFDTSGSMNEPDSNGMTKLDGARKAGAQILNVIEAENAALASKSQAGVVSFHYSASVNAPLSDDIAAARTALDNLFADGGTGMPDGLRSGLELLSGSQDNQVIILLSDGIPNIGLNGEQYMDPAAVQQQVFDLADEAAQRRVCIHTVGLGDPSAGVGSIDEAFLQEVASRSGCGTYKNAADAIELANVYVELRHTSTGAVLLNEAGMIAQGQELDLGTVTVDQNQETMLFTLNWPGSRLEPILVDPAGATVDANYPGASVSTTSSMVSIILGNPAAGDWKLRILGSDVPEGQTNFKALLSTRAGVTAPAAVVAPAAGVPLALVTGVIAASMVGVYAYSRTLKRSARRRSAAAACLHGVSGNFAGQVFAVQDGTTIGRGSTSTIRISDPAVSRNHAVLRYSDGMWFIQDPGSAGGVLVNGQRVSAVRLNPGDQVQIGGHFFRFEIG